MTHAFQLIEAMISMDATTQNKTKKKKNKQKRQNQIVSFRVRVSSCAINRSRHNFFSWHITNLTMKRVVVVVFPWETFMLTML